MENQTETFLQKYDWLFIVVGRLAVAMLIILAFLSLGSFLSREIVSATDRAEQGERFQTQTHKAENLINRAKE